MGTPDTASTGGAEHHAEPQHNAFAHELLAADPAVHDVGPGETSAQQSAVDGAVDGAVDRGADDEDRFDAG